MRRGKARFPALPGLDDWAEGHLGNIHVSGFKVRVILAPESLVFGNGLIVKMSGKGLARIQCLGTWSFNVWNRPPPTLL